MDFQGGKQIKEIEERGKQLVGSNALIKKYDIDKYNPSFLKQKEIFDKTIDEMCDEILKLIEKVNYYH